MDINKLILALALNTKSCIDFLKVHKNRYTSSRLHGAKKNIIRYLLQNYTLLECRRVLQFNPNHKNANDGHCMVKFVFDVIGTTITFHLPYSEAIESIRPYHNFKFTTKKVKLIFNLIPPDNELVYSNIYQVDDVIKLLNNMPSLKSTQVTEKHSVSLKDTYLQRLENYVVNESPLKLSL